MFAVIVESFVEDHQLYLSAGWCAKRAGFIFNELTDIRTIQELFVTLFVTGAGLVSGLDSGPGFCDLLVEFDFWRDTMELRCMYWIVSCRFRLCDFSVWHCACRSEQRWVRGKQEEFWTRSHREECKGLTRRSTRQRFFWLSVRSMYNWFWLQVHASSIDPCEKGFCRKVL